MAQKKKIVIEDENDKTLQEPPSTPSDRTMQPMNRWMPVIR